jgi:hypothetical protein
MEKTSESAVLEDLKLRCCLLRCMDNFSFEAVYDMRMSFWKVVVSTQNLMIQEHRRQVYQERCVVNGHQVCTNAWRIVHGVSRSRSVMHIRY